MLPLQDKYMSGSRAAHRNWSSMAHKNNSRCRHFASTNKKRKHLVRGPSLAAGMRTSRIRNGDGQTAIMRCQRRLSSGFSGEQWRCLDPSDLFQVLSKPGRGLRTTDGGGQRPEDDFHANKRRRAQHFLSHNEQQQRMPGRDSWGALHTHKSYLGPRIPDCRD